MFDEYVVRAVFMFLDASVDNSANNISEECVFRAIWADNISSNISEKCVFHVVCTENTSDKISE